MANPENQVIEIIPTLLVGDNAFDPANIPACTLCVELGEQQIRFCIIRDEQMECIWLEDYVLEPGLSADEIFEKLRRIFLGHMLWSSQNWKSVRLAVNSGIFSLVPQTVFEEKSASDYLSFAAGNPLPKTERVLHHELPLVHARNVFSIPESWYEWIGNHFGSAQVSFYHLTSPLIIGALVSHIEQQELRIVSIYLEKDHFTVIVTESRQLMLCNRFRYSQTQELAYIILFTLSQIGFSPEEVKVLCYGQIDETAEVYTELSHFFPNLQLGSRPSTLKYSRACAEVPGHRYFGLFNTYLVSS